MKICIPSEKKFEHSIMSSHFGKAHYMALIEVENGQVVSWEFKSYPHTTCGELAIMLRKDNVEIIISHGIAKTLRIVLNSFGIKIFRAEGLSVKQALGKWLAGDRKKMPLSDIHSHLPNPGIKGGVKET
jgi:predicted Fe-Mo cluster-binding NifX family protein